MTPAQKCAARASAKRVVVPSLAGEAIREPEHLERILAGLVDEVTLLEAPHDVGDEPARLRLRDLAGADREPVDQPLRLPDPLDQAELSLGRLLSLAALHRRAVRRAWGVPLGLDRLSLDRSSLLRHRRQSCRRSAARRREPLACRTCTPGRPRIRLCLELRVVHYRSRRAVRPGAVHPPGPLLSDVDELVRHHPVAVRCPRPVTPRREMNRIALGVRERTQPRHVASLVDPDSRELPAEDTLHRRPGRAGKRSATSMHRRRLGAHTRTAGTNVRRLPRLPTELHCRLRHPVPYRARCRRTHSIRSRHRTRRRRARRVHELDRVARKAAVEWVANLDDAVRTLELTHRRSGTTPTPALEAAR